MVRLHWPHQWYWLKSKNYKKDGANFTCLEITIALKNIIQKTSARCKVKFISENGSKANANVPSFMNIYFMFWF